MKIHVLVTFTPCPVLHKSRTSALDLDTAPSFLLYVLHIGPAMTDNLGPQIEARDGLEIDRNFLFRPFALIVSVNVNVAYSAIYTYSTKLVSFNLFRFSSTKTSFVNQIWKFLFH